MLTPTQAATLAQQVYDAKNSISVSEAFLQAGLSGVSIASSQLISGRTGGNLIKKKRIFAMSGSFTKSNRKHLVVVFRGTIVELRHLHDLLTNANTGMTVGSTTSRVHAGFHQVFESLKEDLTRIMGSTSDHPYVHFIGHSLGGAVATLAADWVKATHSIRHVKLYTFGAPRPGVELFAKRLTQRLSHFDQYRLFHQTDPVPTVPIFPFVHAPMPGHGYEVPSRHLPLFKAHSITNYQRSVEGKGWHALNVSPPTMTRPDMIKHWLRSTKQWNLVDAISAKWLERALAWTISQGVNKGITKVNTFLFDGSTVIDTLARVCRDGIKTEHLRDEKDMWFTLLVKRIAGAVGVRIKEELKDITLKTVRYVLGVMMQRLGEIVRKSVEQMF